MKKIRVLIIVIIIINLLISIFLLSYYLKKNNGNSGTPSDEFIASSIEINEKILPENYKKFEELYDDKENCQKFYKDLYSFVRYIPKLYERIKDLNGKELEDFYEKNKVSIKNRFFIDKKDEFIQLVTEVKKAYKNGQSDYRTVIIYPDTFKKYTTHVECDFEIILYNGEVLKYKLNISNSQEKLAIYFKPMNEV